MAALVVAHLPLLAASAADYYVDGARGADVRDGLTEQTAWQTIAKANGRVQPGDTVLIRGGTYAGGQGIHPARSGEPDARITYRNYPGEHVLITEVEVGVHIDGKSYITVSGLDFSNLDHFLFIEGAVTGYRGAQEDRYADHNVIEYCTFDQGRRIGWNGSKINKNARYNWVHHCHLSRYGKFDGDDIGALFDVGVADLMGDKSGYNLIEQNTFSRGGHHPVGIFSSYNVFRDNYIHSEEWSEYNGRKWGNRCLTVDGRNTQRNLIERNRLAFGGVSCDDWGGSGAKISTPRNIVRFNCMYANRLPGLSLTAYRIGAEHNYIYNNTIYGNGRAAGIVHPVLGSMSATSPYLQGIDIYYGARRIHSNVLKNNLLYKNARPSLTPPGRNQEAQVLSHNWEHGDPLFVDEEIPEDPADASRPDLRLRAGSPCIDKGGLLTRITSEDGTGETLQVEDAGYFMDGWGIVEGDLIQLETGGPRARIVRVDYERNVLVVDTTLTWRRGTGVSLAFVGAAPDVGAFEWSPQEALTK